MNNFLWSIWLKQNFYEGKMRISTQWVTWSTSYIGNIADVHIVSLLCFRCFFFLLHKTLPQITASLSSLWKAPLCDCDIDVAKMNLIKGSHLPYRGKLSSQPSSALQQCFLQVYARVIWLAKHSVVKLRAEVSWMISKPSIRFLWETPLLYGLSWDIS